MTYARGGASSPPANGGRLPLGPRNSLDYWNKSEDWQGVTTYYWNKDRGGGGTSPYGMENVYAQSPARRPAPFPLNLPVSKPSPASPRTAPSSPSQTTGNYQNVPIPRVRMPDSHRAAVNGSARITPPKDSPIFPAKQGPESLIWSISSHNNQQHHHHHHHNNHVAPMTTNSPQITRVAVTPAHAARLANEKCHRVPRQKPRWGRFMRTLCCCVVQQPPAEKTVPHPHPQPTSPSLLITQVQKNGNAYNDVPHYPRPAPQQQPELKTNEYSPGPTTVIPQQPRQPSPEEKGLKNGERPLLPPLRPADVHKKCLIIDLDETLVHSSFKPVKNADFVIPVEIDGVEHKVYVLKRPYVDEFLERVGERFECVLFTASLAKYADPVADLLDKRGVFRARLFREACVYHKGNYVKDLARLGRDLHKVVIIDNSPASYAFHPENAVAVQTWFDDPTDCELLELVPMLERMDRLESIYHATCRDDSPSDALLERSLS